MKPLEVRWKYILFFYVTEKGWERRGGKGELHREIWQPWFICKQYQLIPQQVKLKYFFFVDMNYFLNVRLLYI